MRGSPRSGVPCGMSPGIIPAHAGLTERDLDLLALPGDHPRACGAHVLSRISRITVPGSSPRMRGSRKLIHGDHLSCRIIPAHAGLTPWISFRSLPDRDHPRACGAHEQFLQAGTSPEWIIPAHAGLTHVDKNHYEAHMGSSPRMRGSRTVVAPRQLRPGIIPAHAGLTP